MPRFTIFCSWQFDRFSFLSISPFFILRNSVVSVSGRFPNFFVLVIYILFPGNLRKSILIFAIFTISVFLFSVVSLTIFVAFA